MEPVSVTNGNLFACMQHTIDAAKQAHIKNDDTDLVIGACLAFDFEPMTTAKSGDSNDSPIIHLLSTSTIQKDKLSHYSLFTTVGPDEIELDAIIHSGIKTFYFGMYNPAVEHLENIIKKIVDNRMKIEFYRPDYVQIIEDQNRKTRIFYDQAFNRATPSVFDLPNTELAGVRTLDEWYTIINRIYADKNYAKPVYEIFCHFVEIIGGLSVLSTNKTEKLVEPASQIVKAIAWWFALNGKVGIRSVEDLVFYKFPNVCPYCEEEKHDKDKCNQVKLKGNGPNWSHLISKSEQNVASRPRTISSWQQMFYKIYPVGSDSDFDYAYSRLTEELGELAEAIRCMDISPSYFLSESADLFAWLMHLSNLYESKTNRRITKELRGSYLERKIFELYPDQCKDCGNVICTCAPILKTTVGRISNDGPNYGLFKSVKPFLAKDEFAAQFDASSDEILIGSNSFKVDREVIKSVRAVSEYLLVQLRKLRMSDSDKPDAVIISLQRIHSMVVTQRVNQHSIDSLIKSILALEQTDRLTIASELKNFEKNDIAKSILAVLQN